MRSDAKRTSFAPEQDSDFALTSVTGNSTINFLSVTCNKANI